MCYPGTALGFQRKKSLGAESQAGVRSQVGVGKIPVRQNRKGGSELWPLLKRTASFFQILNL